jgi:hypothetical protein
MSRRVLPLVASLLVLAFFTVGGMARRTTTTTTVPRTSRGRGAPDQQYSCTSSLGFDLIIPISDTTFNCLPGALLQDRQDPRRWMIQCYAAIGYGTAQRTLVSTLLMVDGKVTALNRTISGGVLSVSQDPLTNTVFFYNELDPQTPNNLYTMQFADTFEQAQATIQAHVVGIQIAALVAWANSALVVDLSVTELDLYNQAGRWQPQTVLTNIAASNGFNQDSANYLGVAILAVQSPQPAFYSVELPKYLNSSWGAPIKLATYSDCQGAQATLISSEILVISCADTGIFALNLTSNTTTPIITALLCQQNSLLRYDRQSDTMILGCANNILMVQHLQQRPLPAQIATVPFASDTVCSQLQDAAVDHTTGQWLLSCGNGVFHATGFSASPIVSNIPGCPNLSGLEYDGTRGIFYINCNGGGLFAVRNGHVEPLITPTPPALCSSPSSMAVDSVTGYLYLLCGTSMVRFNGTDAIQFAVVPGQVDDLEVYDGILYQLSNSQLLYYNLTSPTSSEWTTIPATYVGAFWAHADTAYIVTGVPPQDSVYAINLLTGNSTTWTCTGNCAASGIFGDPLRGLLFVTDEFFKIVDMKTMAVLVHLPAPPWAGYQDQNVVIAQDEITQLLYVARPEGLFSIDPTLGLKGVWTLLPTNGNCPTTIGLIYDPLTSVLFTACATTGTILASASKFRCGNGFAWTGAGCSACLVGSAVSVSPADLFSFDILQCQPCPSGSIAPWSGMASCEICQPGSFDDASLTEVCSLCAPGRHQNVSGQATCVECENVRDQHATTRSNILFRT